MPPRLKPLTPTPYETPLPTATDGSLVGRAVDVSETKTTGIKAVFYGVNRTGKTTLAATFPGPLLFLSFEPPRAGGLDSVTRVLGARALVRGTHFHTFAEAVRIGEELASGGGCGYRTVVIDSATSFEEFSLESILKDRKAGALSVVPEQMEYGVVSAEEYRDRSSRAKFGLSAFLSLPVNVVVTAKEKDHNPPREEKINPKTGKLMPDMRAKWLRKMGPDSLYGPALGSATAGWLNDACGIIARLYWAPEVTVTETVSEILGERVVNRVEAETGEYVLRMRLKQHPNYMGGLRAADPDKVPSHLDNPTYAKLLQIVNASS